ncbi:DUF2281 domain-containing protein [Autumnicola musiva]|uniref:DUF2281 domain-containing protein n=1 Tax=Autumnicola musiva TaxID=3075589 RepID=A0ABU3D243_9FLAO|nr:DUF2281 domain-containing protein [Zunongwangia sp. F117]MDT0675614.1 hypothetical protein [Zunongwangia sp. F117]
MTRQNLIENALDKLEKLPDIKIEEVSDFAEFLLKKIEDKNLTEGIRTLATNSTSYKFLKDEEELYSTKDLKDVYK